MSTDLLQKPDAILLVDKKTSVSSFDVIRRIKGAFRVAGNIQKLSKIGHAGTLDPIASGLLIILINAATKKSESFLTLDKAYEAELLIGQSTDTYDSTGEVLDRLSLMHDYFDAGKNEDTLKRAIDSFVGEIMQEPPMYSAIKKNGSPLYKLARKGITVEREKRKCNIYAVDHAGSPLYDIEKQAFKYTFKVKCSKGTYIRSLCHDIGIKLNIPCHMSGLRRTEVGPYSVSKALAFDDINFDSVMAALIY